MPNVDKSQHVYFHLFEASNWLLTEMYVAKISW